MGNWNITIQGIGPHHNKDAASDADEIAKQMVFRLRQFGHNVTSATITHGAAEDLLPLVLRTEPKEPK